MVSSDEIRSRLEAQRLGQDPDSYAPYEGQGFLVCEECGSYYELQKGESPEDFSLECDCGGRLIYQKFLESPYTNKSSSGKILAIILGIGITLMLIMVIYPYIQIVLLFALFEGNSPGTYVLIFLVLALIFSGAYSGYYLIKIILRSN